MHAERVQVERGTHGLEGEAGDLRGRQLAAQQIEQQGSDQRAMHDEAGVALDFGDVLAVVMDAVAIEGQGRIAKQQHRVGRDRARPSLLASQWRLLGYRHRVGGLGLCPVNNVVLLGQREALGIAIGMLHLHKHQLTRAPALVRHGLDARSAFHGLPHTQGVGLLPAQAPAGPHAPRQRHRRQKAAAPGVAVWAQLALARKGQKIHPVPQRRQHRALRGRRVFSVQRGR